MAIYHFDHKSVGKTTHTRSYVAKQIGYCARAFACAYMATVNIPARDGMTVTPVDIGKFFYEHWDNSRANARIYDRFVGAMPAELDFAQHTRLINKFNWAITNGGKGAVATFFHTDREHNPHIHVLYFDRDKDGKIVRGMSKQGSTKQARALWESVVNNFLEEEGIEARIDRRSMRERAIELAHEAKQQELSPETPESELEAAPELDNVEPTEVAMSDRLQQALYFNRELHVLRAEREHLRQLQEDARRERENATQLRDDAERVQTTVLGLQNTVDFADARMAELQKDNGKLKGFHIKAFGFEWKSATRKAAEVTQEVTLIANQMQAAKKAEYEDLDHQAKFSDATATELETKAQAVEFFLRTRGTDEDLNISERLMEHNRAELMKDVTPDDVHRMYEDGEISVEDYKSTLEMMGAQAEYEERVGDLGEGY